MCEDFTEGVEEYEQEEEGLGFWVIKIEKEF